MNSRIIFALSASALAFGFGLHSCAPSALAKGSESVSSNPKRAASVAAKSEQLMAKGKTQKAVLAAEEAVSYDFRNPDMRHLLGRAYLADGRLVSAEQAFRDTLELQPHHPGAMLSLALVRIALGDSDEGRRILHDAEGLISDSDRGLGLALAGDFDTAIPLLKREAQADSENVKVRQNLAFALAMNGQWREARAVAGYDLGPGQVADRIGEWAQLAHPANSYDQVAYLLNIRPVEDQGQPVRLALGPVSGNVKMASSEPILPVTQYYPEVDSGVGANSGQSSATVAAAPLPKAAEIAPGMESVDIVPEPTQISEQAMAYSPAIQFISGEVVQPLPFVPEAQRAAGLAPKVARAQGPAGSSASKAFITENVSVKPRKAVQNASSGVSSAPGAAPNGKGKYVVQIGAFSNADAAKKGWTKTVSQNPSLSSHTPISSSFKVKPGKSFVRLAIGGYASRAEADETCRSIKAEGGVCFVRPVTSDVVPQWAKAAGGSKSTAVRR